MKMVDNVCHTFKVWHTSPKENGLPKSIARCTTLLTLFARSSRGFFRARDILNAKGV